LPRVTPTMVWQAVESGGPGLRLQEPEHHSQTQALPSAATTAPPADRRRLLAPRHGAHARPTPPPQPQPLQSRAVYYHTTSAVELTTSWFSDWATIFMRAAFNRSAVMVCPANHCGKGMLPPSLSI